MDDRKRTAERIKAARSIAGYSERKAFCLKFGFPHATLEAWERGKNPLTSKGAKRLVEVLRGVGIYCSEEWLREGSGLSPRPLQELSEDLGGASSESFAMLSKNLAVAKEISTFITLNKAAVVTLVTDDAMLPFYKTGDYVGGIKYEGDQISKALNKKCIIELVTGKNLVRQLYPGKQKGRYTLSTVPLDMTKPPLIEYDMDVVSAAPILWHRNLLLKKKRRKDGGTCVANSSNR
jgi:transcriptional regulator with XRE-family HTH domain